MKHVFSLIGFAALSLAPVSMSAAAPVHIALKAEAIVSPDASGFFALGTVATLSGGDAAGRARLAAVCVGRAPLSGENRLLTRGDLSLKLRQAGCDPDKDAVLEGASQVTVTVGVAPPAPEPLHPTNNGGARDERVGELNPYVGAGSPRPPVAFLPVSQPLIHRGDTVSIVVQTDGVTVTARGIARDNGGVGDTIRVHREGVMTDLSVTVLDSQTVRLEI